MKQFKLAAVKEISTAFCSRSVLVLYWGRERFDPALQVAILPVMSKQFNCKHHKKYEKTCYLTNTTLDASTVSQLEIPVVINTNLNTKNIFTFNFRNYARDVNKPRPHLDKSKH